MDLGIPRPQPDDRLTIFSREYLAAGAPRVLSVSSPEPHHMHQPLCAFRRLTAGLSTTARYLDNEPRVNTRPAVAGDLYRLDCVDPSIKGHR